MVKQLATLLFFGCSHSPASAPGPVDAAGTGGDLAAPALDCAHADVSTLRGVNFLDGVLTGKTWTTESLMAQLAEVKSAGFNFIRVPYWWESYVLNSSAQAAELAAIANAADALGLCVLYDSHEGHTSSYFNPAYPTPGKGFPPSFLAAYPTTIAGEEQFWADYYNNATAAGGASIWDQQAAFEAAVVDLVDNHSSTHGFEILNEPHIYACPEYAGVGQMHAHVGAVLRMHTAKPLHADSGLVFPGSTCTSMSATLLGQSVPTGIANLVFHAHIYEPGAPTTKLAIYSLVATNANIPLFIGEWSQTMPNLLTQSVMSAYMTDLKAATVGWSFWAWQNAATYPCKDSAYNDTVYLGYLENALKASYGQ